MDMSSIGPDLVEAAHGLQDTTVELRRAIHAEPEIGLDNPRTQAKILDALTGLGLDITTGESLTSVVADLDTGRPGPTILLRGDMDALPLQEDNDIPYRSQFEQVMHACGHDSHVAMLLSAARLLAENKDQLNGRIRFMFQPGEEGYHGAKYMIDEGVLDGVDRAFAIHIVTTMPSGRFYSKPGPVLASADRFELTVTGKGGHASMPADCIDPIPAAAATVLGLHTMVGRARAATDPAVITVANIHSGTTNNIIPESAFMEGTLRTFSETTRAHLKEQIEQVASHTSAAHGCSCTTNIVPGYPVTVNDALEVERSERTANAIFGDVAMEMLPHGIMAAEDFSYVLNEVPGSMATLGVCPPDVPLAEAAPNHSNFMVIDEDAMQRGVALYAAMAMA
ncbi:MAG: M20 metallopeptidase family protein [Acidimicrobiales bacterium]